MQSERKANVLNCDRACTILCRFLHIIVVFDIRKRTLVVHSEIRIQPYHLISL